MEIINSINIVNTSKLPDVATIKKSNPPSVKPEVNGNVLPEKNVIEAGSKNIEKTVRDLNSFVQSVQRGIQFKVHEETGHSVVIVTDKETGEEIRKFPSDEVLAIAEQIAEKLAVSDTRNLGVLINRSA